MTKYEYATKVSSDCQSVFASIRAVKVLTKCMSSWNEKLCSSIIANYEVSVSANCAYESGWPLQRSTVRSSLWSAHLVRLCLYRNRLADYLCLSLCLSVCLSVCPSVCLFVCLFMLCARAVCGIWQCSCHLFFPLYYTCVYLWLYRDVCVCVQGSASVCLNIKNDASSGCNYELTYINMREISKRACDIFITAFMYNCFVCIFWIRNEAGKLLNATNCWCCGEIMPENILDFFTGFYLIWKW